MSEVERYAALIRPIIQGAREKFRRIHSDRAWCRVAVMVCFVLAKFILFATIAQAQSPAARPVPGAPAGVTVFADVTVVPMDIERVLPKQTVLVEGGWITALGPNDQVKVPAGALILARLKAQ